MNITPLKGGGMLKTKNTNDLRQELAQATDLDYFLEANEQTFQLEPIPDLLNRLVAEKNIQKANLARNSGMSEVYLHQVFSGRRNPSRSRIISLCFGLGLNLEESQELLRRSGYAELYPHNRRDAILIYGLIHEMNFFEINDRLFEKGEETVC